MAKTLNYNNIKKQYLTLTFNDDKKTVVMIKTATKALLKDLIELQNSYNENAEDLSDEMIDELYDISAKLMSRNKTNKIITVEFLENIFDFEDITIFLNAYMEFMGEMQDSKN